MPSSSPKKVLMIAYLFPPAGGGGVQRTSKFTKFLPEFGWEPRVLTVKEPYDFYQDDSLLEDIASPQIIVYRTRSIEPMKWVRKWLKKKSGSGLEPEPGGNTGKKSLKPGFLVTLKTWLLVPDNEIFWLPFAVWKGWQIIRREKISLIYSTASPFTDHLIALILAKITGRPWVADFRDFWVDRANFPRNRWRMFIDRQLEKQVLKNADRVVTATELISRRFREIVPTTSYHVITNGFDEEDFSGTENLSASEKNFVIVYTGIFNREQNPAPFFSAVHSLLADNQKFRRHARLKLIGQLDNPGDFENYLFFRKLGLHEYAEVSSYQPHRQVIQEICRATVLFLLIGDYPHNRAVMTGKIFEYLRAGRPILAAVPPDGIAAAVIRETGTGLVVPNNDSNAIAAGIMELFNLYLQGQLDAHFRGSGIMKFNRKNLTARLADIFNQLDNEMNAAKARDNE